MFVSYLRTAFRNIIKYKGYSFINIAGLGFGIACFFLITLFVADELSYDKFNEKSHRTYRVAMHALMNNNLTDAAASCAPLAPTLMSDFPEVEVAVRSRNYGFPVFRYEDKVFSEERVFWVDSTFFDVFTVEFIYGDPRTALTQPRTMVMTESMAQKYFGDVNPVGLHLNSDNRQDVLITGVIKDVPRNSHFHYDFLQSLYAYNVDQDIIWLSNNFQTYVVLREDADPDEFERKMNDMLLEKADPQVRQFLGISVQEFLGSGGEYRYYLQPMEDIHLHSHLDFEVEPNGSYTYVLIFSIIAIGILLVACINFVNLSTAKSANRAREVGIRKTAGSTRGQLITQFLSEAVVMSFMAVVLALVIASIILPAFNHLAGKQMPMSMLLNAANLPWILLLVLVIGFFAGTYPAFFMASFQPVAVMKGDKGKRGARTVLRNVLVVSQFAISIMLIIGTLVVKRQMDYIQSKDLGYSKENVVIVKKTDDLGDRLNAFKLESLESSHVISVSNSTNIMGEPFGNNVFMVPGSSGEESHLLWTNTVDPDFLDVYQMKMAQGRFFEESRPADYIACVINETAAQSLGFEHPVGRELAFPGGAEQNIPNLKILGVVKDFHFQTMNTPIRPLIFLPFRPNQRGRNVSVRIQPGDPQAALHHIQRAWNKVALGQNFEYEFFEDHFARLFMMEVRTGRILMAFSILAVIIASLGLFGLAAFAAEQRTKEIGIRKVMGATVPVLTFLMIRQFTKWVLIANVIAWPVSYFIMKKWLQNFAYQAGLDWWIFVFSLLIALAVAVLTVSWQSIRAALIDPARSLRYE